ncbi:uncharacterized protein B0H64DRAFT_449466 [Chaetomium fimeti]|uniref:DUF7603 domain-containing protein n=1 Tax=Chaetomium fimeti TaxID=1854472 RepID=A0AAE0HQJ7_9PEZI|nr:hypothetical protein B0H64DRAFT_449466 [Chaetomium fimeti]
MAAPGPTPEGDMPPPLPATTIPVLPDSDDSDTRVASSDLTTARSPPLPVPHPLSFETHDQTDAFPELVSVLPKHPLPSPRSGRSFSLAHLSGPIKRKPLSSTASPAAVRFSKGAAAYADLLADLPRPDQRFARSCSLDSPTLYEFPDQRSLLATESSLNTVLDWPASPPDTSQPSSPVSDYFVEPAEPAAVPAVGGAGDAQLRNTTGNNPAAATQISHTLSEEESLSAETASLTTQGSVPYELDDLYSIPDSPESSGEKRATIINTNNPKTMSLFARKSPPPQLILGSNTRDVPAATASATSLDQSNLNKPLPKSPASSKLSALFGWATTPSPTTATEYSDKNFSPLPSPTSPKPTTAVTESYDTSIITKRDTYSNVADPSNPLQYCEAYLQTPADSTTSLGQLEEMEDELKGISVELASSIRREMDLEDLVDRLQEQINNPQAPGKRTSDYFSDSGYSSAKFSEYDHAKEEISQIQRRAEQEKAQIRLELTNKLQDERSKRRSLDQQIQELSRRASELDVAHLDSSDANGRVKELESMCEDLSRRLSQQSEATTNLEGLLDALQGELQTAANERDNLRDEVVPQLRARLEGLEAEAADQARLAYDTSKMQQELELLKSQNAELDSLRAQTAELDSLRAQTAELDSLKAQTAELDSLKSQNAELQMLRSQNAELHMLRSQNAELKQTGTRMSMALSRSVSVTGGPLRKNRTQSISRSNSTKVIEPRDVLAERLKDVEAQRDALHSALRSLLERQELQNRESTKRIRQLEMERDRLLTSSPKKAGYERDVSNLREEISVLRRRAEEAIEQKWQVEKGLAGLKMDLDRAEGEIASLRSLLQEKDILIPEALARPGSSHSQSDLPVSSHSLEQAYEDLQAAYMDALERIKALEENARPDERTQLAIQRLEQSLSAAISDRDHARNEAASYRDQVETLQTLEKEHLDTESDLAAQLHEYARRVEELAQQVRIQLEANTSLRTRLAGTIARGDAEQRVSTERISGMQSRLRTLEEQVVAAQTGAEERVTRHEEELAALRDAHSTQLHRLRNATGAAGGPRRGSGQGQRVFPPKSPLSPMFSLRTAPAARTAPNPAFLNVDDAANPHQTHPGRPGVRRSATEPVDMDMTAQMNTLKGRVAELEGALASADAEMQEVVGRMNTAQIEVLQLQERREEAVRETRRLQRVLEEERVRVFEGRFRSLVTEVR